MNKRVVLWGSGCDVVAGACCRLGSAYLARLE